MPADLPNAPRRPYRPPTLRVYGALADFTLTNASSMGMTDMGAGGMNKTGF